MIFLLSGCCLKKTGTGWLTYHCASLKSAATVEEARKLGYLQLLETHPYREGWDHLDVEARAVSPDEMHDLLAEEGSMP
jgi:hypothetical protein